MTQITPQMIEQRRRTIDDRLLRLRARLKDARNVEELRNVMLGMVDLLNDVL